jgi:hypothetical protein
MSDKAFEEYFKKNCDYIDSAAGIRNSWKYFKKEHKQTWKASGEQTIKRVIEILDCCQPAIGTEPILNVAIEEIKKELLNE